MTINPSDLQAVVDRLEAGEDLSEWDLQLLATALRSRLASGRSESVLVQTARQL